MHRTSLWIGILGCLVAAAHAQGPDRGGEGKSHDPAQILHQFDRDGDGRISREEAPDRMKQRWDDLDTDKDGFVTRDELQAREDRVSKGEGRGPGGAPGGPKREAGPGFQPGADFSVITVGSGSPRYDPDRSGPCSMIQCRGRYYLVDMGNGTQARLEDAGVPSRQIDALVLTHHHLDHDEEFTPLFLHTRLAGGKPAIVGAPGTKKRVDFILEFYAEDIAYRLRRVGKAAEDFPAAEVREVQGGESFDLGPMKVSTAKVNHTIHTVAYRFDLAGRSIVISGDLSYSDSLVELAKGADVLVIDSGGSIVEKGAEPRKAGREGGDPTKAHGSREDVIAMAKKSGAKKLVLTHIAVGEVDEEATISGVRDGYDGEVLVAHDLLEVVPGAGTRTTSGSARVYVSGAPAQARDGKGWTSAFATVQEGIDAAAAAGGGEVWVASGAYTPAGADRAATFRLRARVAVYGGFAGKETERDKRDWEKNRTVLSGDIGRAGVADDNCFHVVTGADDATLDGFTITGGCGEERRGHGGAPPIHTTPEAVLEGASSGSGGGMVNFQCAPTVSNCTFEDNHAGKGGAMYNMVSKTFPPRREGSPPAPVVTNCRFLKNSARGRGGAVANDLGTSPTFRGCTFVGNRCDEKGGALYDDFGCSPTLVNCLFAENRAASAAGMGNDGGSSPLLVHCTFSRNVATGEGGALYQGTGPANDPVVVGCILWEDEASGGAAEIYDWHDDAPQVEASCVEGGYAGEGNLDADPRFVDASHGDYRLAAGSPCAAMGYTVATPDDLLARYVRRAAPERRDPPAKAGPKRGAGPARVICVNAAAAGAGDGKSWKTAFPTLQAAMADARDDRAEVWVAAGVYEPTDGKDRAASFQLRSNVDLYGGFRGGEAERADRDWKANITVLSGDIGEDGNRSDDSYHVVVGADGAVLDGFAIRDRFADGRTYDGKGGGMINYARAPQSGPMGPATGYSPVVRNCTFEGNYAHAGGAVYDYDRGAPQYENCRFVWNMAEEGGAIVERVGVKATMTECVFEKNQARWKAGAVSLDYGARLTMTKCRFEGNECDGDGGAIAMVSRASQLENTVALLKGCWFEGNLSRGRGGAIAASDASILALDSCVFSTGHAATGGGVAIDGRARAVVLVCTFSENRAEVADADIASDDPGAISRDESDWPK